MNPAKVLVVTILAGTLSIGAALFGERWFARHDLDFGGGRQDDGRIATLPDLRLPDLSGQEVASNAWAGKVVVLNFWASWCPSCLKEMPMLDELQRGVDPGRLKVVGVAIDAPDEVQRFLGENRVDYQIVLGGADTVELSRRLGNRTSGLPFTVVFDALGRRVYSHTGEITPADVRERILPLLQAEPG
ncbi:MAG: TlpA family protein disulfide reductase [Thiohalocapsa sp.]|jgi:thiol-disulfide isomerase/thioredoxin|uniref:TlpA family protein disulfide reductase n=1 Tax=Thiohalocapsa sp. TaxID=2497641 RepID=UPI0025FE5D5C|nr:TlpA disulfide reductase family protein [Thiohalocapsa sp.]MCG6941537.1 TlpA family protein disulfide reductase [Thiohalocapsa sp.]